MPDGGALRTRFAWPSKEPLPLASLHRSLGVGRTRLRTGFFSPPGVVGRNRTQAGADNSGGTFRARGRARCLADREGRGLTPRGSATSRAMGAAAETGWPGPTGAGKEGRQTRPVGCCDGSPWCAPKARAFCCTGGQGTRRRAPPQRTDHPHASRSARSPPLTREPLCRSRGRRRAGAIPGSPGRHYQILPS